MPPKRQARTGSNIGARLHQSPTRKPSNHRGVLPSTGPAYVRNDQQEAGPSLTVSSRPSSAKQAGVKLPQVSPQNGAASARGPQGPVAMRRRSSARQELGLNETEWRRKLNINQNYNGPVFVPEATNLRCGGCGQNVDAITRVLIGARPFHPRCLVCCFCGKKDDGIYKEYRGRPMCEKCSRNEIKAKAYLEEQKAKIAEQNVATRVITTTKVETCNSCFQELTGKIVSTSTGQFHAGCFRCTHCNQTFGPEGAYVELNSKPYHPNCALEVRSLEKAELAKTRPDNHTTEPVSSAAGCRGCEREITGEFVEVVGRGKFHPSCFRCKQCQRTLRGRKFFEDPKTGGAFCLQCGRQ